MNWRYLHLDFTRTGILDYILAVYEKRLYQGQVDFEVWVRNEYDQTVLHQGFNKRLFKDTTLDLLAGLSHKRILSEKSKSL